MSTPKTITIDDTVYVRADTVPAAQPKGTRCIVVVDRGWIYAGDVSEADGRIFLDRAVWVFKWTGVGFAAVIADPSKADIRPVAYRVDIPAGAEIYRVPVPQSWGL
tara:strand:+ start:390 stop:707 length:318 start_codon:yes stop_codon:yes gene_type:complete